MSRADDLEALTARLGPAAHRDAALGSRTTYRVGGRAALGVEVADEDALLDVARALRGLDVPVLVMGNGSNLLVADAGFAGLVVTLGTGFETLGITANEVRAGGALALPTLARRTAAATTSAPGRPPRPVTLASIPASPGSNGRWGCPGPSAGPCA